MEKFKDLNSGIAEMNLQFVVMGDVESAVKIAQNLLGQYPGMNAYGGVLSFLGKYMAQLGDYIDSLISQNNSSAAFSITDTWLDLVQTLLHHPNHHPGNNQLCAAMLSGITARYNKIAKISNNLEAYQKAVYSAELAFEALPHPQLAHNVQSSCRAWALYCYSHRLWQQAIPPITRAIEIDPNDGEYWFILAAIYEPLGDTDNYIKYMLHAAELGNDEAIKVLASIAKNR
jgi:tetratricopeptide (TPR) repeat protein